MLHLLVTVPGLRGYWYPLHAARQCGRVFTFTFTIAITESVHTCRNFVLYFSSLLPQFACWEKEHLLRLWRKLNTSPYLIRLYQPLFRNEWMKISLMEQTKIIEHTTCVKKFGDGERNIWEQLSICKLMKHWWIYKHLAKQAKFLR